MSDENADWAGRGFSLRTDGSVARNESGMLKEKSGKACPTLVPTSFLWRLAGHMTRGAEKYERDNWRKGRSQAELDGFRDSAFRHFLLWLDGIEDEDHMAAVCFNMWAAEHVRENLNA